MFQVNSFLSVSICILIVCPSSGWWGSFPGPPPLPHQVPLLQFSVSLKPNRDSSRLWLWRCFLSFLTSEDVWVVRWIVAAVTFFFFFKLFFFCQNNKHERVKERWAFVAGIQRRVLKRLTPWRDSCTVGLCKRATWLLPHTACVT